MTRFIILAVLVVSLSGCANLISTRHWVDAKGRDCKRTTERNWLNGRFIRQYDECAATTDALAIQP